MKQTGCVLTMICAVNLMTLSVGAQRNSALSPLKAEAIAINFPSFTSPILFEGDATTAYRDPAAIYDHGMFHLYFTLVKTESDGKVYSYTAWSKSRDLAHWTGPKIFTPRDRNLTFSSPGDIIR